MSQKIFGYESGNTRGGGLAGLTREDIRIDELSPSRWRVTNKRFATGDQRGLLGFIEKLENGFEVMELVDGIQDFAWFTFTTFAEAKAHFGGSQS